MKINGIECRPVGKGMSVNKVLSKRKSGGLYSTMPLEWLHALPPKSGIAKVIAILWCYDGMTTDLWITVKNKIYEEYGVSADRKNKILASLAKSGSVKLKYTTGKAIQVRLIKPKGWK